MRRPLTPGFRSSVAIAAVLLVAAIGFRSAPAAQTRQLVPVAASSLVLRPDAYVGAEVSMTATVEAILSSTAFSVDQDPKNPGKDVLVIAPTLNASPEPGAYVTVVGTVALFDPEKIATLARNYVLDLPQALVDRYRGRPVVVARVVLDAKLVDLAKPPVAPLTPAEQALDQAMKEINAAFPAMRQAIDTTNADVTEENVAVLLESFGEAETFFKGRNAADAVGWAQEAQKIVRAVQESAAGGRWGEATETAGTIQRLCQACHAAHRERQDDGTFRVKSGG